MNTISTSHSENLIEHNQQLLKFSEQLQQTAWKLLDDYQIIPLWESIGANVHIVGSLKTGLLIHKDIDMHIYSDRLSISDSFSVMGKLANRLNLKEVQYKNLIDTEEECIEWHALHEDKYNNIWKFDMIHIRKGSKYDGVVERVADAIGKKLTPELRQTILQIKHDMPKDSIVPGIEVYHAVFTNGVRSYDELQRHRETNPLTNSLDWLP